MRKFYYNDNEIKLKGAKAFSLRVEESSNPFGGGDEIALYLSSENRLFCCVGANERDALYVEVVEVAFVLTSEERSFVKVFLGYEDEEDYEVVAKFNDEDWVSVIALLKYALPPTSYGELLEQRKILRPSRVVEPPKGVASRDEIKMAATLEEIYEAAELDEEIFKRVAKGLIRGSNADQFAFLIRECANLANEIFENSGDEAYRDATNLANIASDAILKRRLGN